MKMNHVQKQWFDKASFEERKAFLRNGKPYAGEVWYGENFEEKRFVPMVRGVRLSGDFPTLSAAYDKAVKILTAWQNENLPEIDVETLGISFENQEAAERFVDEYRFAVEKIIHIASQFEHACDDFTNFIDSDAFDNLDIFNGGKAFEKEMEICVSGGEKEEIPSLFYNYGICGWLIQVAQPKYANFSENGASFSWGCYYIKWIYAESYAAALKKAEAWSEWRYEADRVKYE